jgi:NADH-quinone oxidoreductase subunit J
MDCEMRIPHLPEADSAIWRTEMTVLFYISAAIAVFSTAMVITRRHAIHALLYLIASFLAISMVFFLLGAPFIAALEVIIYAGAIMVLFLFAIMMLNLGKASTEQEKHWLKPVDWFIPSLIALALFIEWVYVLLNAPEASSAPHGFTPVQVGAHLFEYYSLGVELASMLLLAGLIGAYHLGRNKDDAGTSGG